MQHFSDPVRPDRTTLGPYKPAVFLSIGVLAAAYGVALVDLGFAGKTSAFAALVLVYLAAAWLIRRREIAASAERLRDSEQAGKLRHAMELLDEACSVFGGSLGAADAFRLAASRIMNICPAGAVRLYQLDESRTFLQAVHSTEQDGRLFIGKTVVPGEGAVGGAYATGCVLDARDSVAIPLFNGSNPFAVLELADPGERREPDTYEKIGEHCSRLILSAVTKDLARDNALVDATTDFPNERAFRLVLENQAAEAQRDRGDRALTVLAIDIKNFDNLNQAFGHAAGDRVLRFTASTIKDNLRAMDFIARSRDDEFLIALPTADARTSREIIERIHAGFRGHKIVINDTQAREIELHIGAAAFGADGETPQQLIGMARLRKQESKCAPSARVLNFPHEPSNLLN